jgi:hypothetical protein
VTKDARHFFMCLLAICSDFVNCVYLSFY